MNDVDALLTWLLIQPIQVANVRPQMQQSMTAIQTSVAALPSKSKTATDNTPSQTTDVELMPPVCEAVNTISITSKAMMVCTMSSNKARTRTTISKHTASTDTTRLACDTRSTGVDTYPKKVVTATSTK